jgi:osmotically-inducible protein OsmY
VRPALCIALCAFAAAAAAQSMVQLDPFAQATSGSPACPPQSPPLLTEQEARAESHVRVERGTRCAMEGTCEPGGAYRRDPELNERVRALIAADRRFADTSVWLTTSRKWVTLRGCVNSTTERRALVAAVTRAPGVERVFDELAVKRTKSQH